MTALLPLLPKCPAHSFRRSSLAPTGCGFPHQPNCFSMTLIFSLLYPEPLTHVSGQHPKIHSSVMTAAMKNKSFCVSYSTCAYPEVTTSAKGRMRRRMAWVSMATSTTLDTELLQVFRLARFLPRTMNETFRCLR